jgi:hypothetical protein
MNNFDVIKHKLNKIKKLLSEGGYKKVIEISMRLINLKFGKDLNIKTHETKENIFKLSKIDNITRQVNETFSEGLIRNITDIKNDIKMLPAEMIKIITEDAEKILKLKFTIYGHLEIDFSTKEFTWLRDPVTGYNWKGARLRYYNNDNDSKGTDIKNIWELARFQFLATLAYAYLITGKDRYSLFAKEMIKLWIKENIFLQGPHWAMPMESSIRLMNWCVYLPLLEIFKKSDCTFKKEFGRTILEHLVFIRENLEYSNFKENNHYLSNIVALISASLIFPKMKWASDCTKFAIKEFEKEILNQFDKSGINFEGSLPYHRLSSEMCAVGIKLIKKTGIELTTKVKERVNQISDFTSTYTRLSEEHPIIGDNDSGVFLSLFPKQGGNRHEYLNVLFNSNFKEECIAKNWQEFICAINFQKTTLNSITENKRKRKRNNTKTNIKNYDGLIIAYNNDEGLFLNTLNSSAGHSHNDKLAIYPAVNGRLVFIDRGSYSYTGYPDKRHQNRISVSHNGPVINEWEQNCIWKDDLFYISNDTNCSRIIDKKNNKIKIIGWHNGYSRFSRGMKVYRKVIWNIIDRTIMISDWIDSKNKKEEYRFSWNFLINPKFDIRIEKNKCILKDKGKSLFFNDIDKVGFILENESYCPNYLQEKKCPAIKAYCHARSNDKINFKLQY